MKLNKIAKVVKDAWLMVGITILLLCLLEGSISLAFLIKDHFSGPGLSTLDYRASADTYSASSWVADYYREFHRVEVTQWKPYVYWRRTPYRGNYINIDTDGNRLTTASPTVTGARQQGSSASVNIFMFGGSTLWGTGARDAFTIPSIVARELHNRGVASRITNFGEAGYVSSQEVIMLLLQLQRGQNPDLVIFYDGINDTYSAHQQHVAGLPQNEFNRVKEFNLSNPRRFRQRTGMVLQDVATRLSTTRLLKFILGRSDIGSEEGLVAKPLLLGNPASDGESLAQDVLSTYVGNIELVTALSEHYRFKSLFYWQPTIFQKANLTKYESAQRDEVKTFEQFFQTTYDLMRQTRLEKSQYHFHDLSLVFSDVREPVYVDWSHLGESGNEMIAKRIANDILGVMTSK